MTTSLRHLLLAMGTAILLCPVSGCGLFRHAAEQQQEDVSPLFERDPVPTAWTFAWRATIPASAPRWSVTVSSCSCATPCRTVSSDSCGAPASTEKTPSSCSIPSATTTARQKRTSRNRKTARRLTSRSRSFPGRATALAAPSCPTSRSLRLCRPSRALRPRRFPRIFP